MENGLVTDQQITASSFFDKVREPANARLKRVAARGRTGAWSARTNDGNQWLQVDFGRNVKVTKFATQGRQDYKEWVESYTIAYSVEGTDFFQAYQENGVDKVRTNYSMFSNGIPLHIARHDGIYCSLSE